VVSIEGDGNCLFRALSHCFHRNERYFHQIRHSIVNYIVDHWDNVCHNIIHLTDLYEVPILSASDYKCYMQQSGINGGHIELVAASQVYKCNIRGGER